MSRSVSTMSGKIKIKIVFLGNQSVGKSSIIEKYTHDKFDETSNPTVGIDFLAKNVSHKAKNYRLQLWDTAGQQRFRSLIPNYLKDAQCALIIYDITNRRSFEAIQSWLNLYNDNHSGQGITFLVGNKIDLQQRQVSTEQAQKAAKQFGMGYCQISAKTGANIVDMFMNILQTCSDRSNAPPPSLFPQKKQQAIKQQKEDDQQFKSEKKNQPSTDDTHSKIKKQQPQPQKNLKKQGIVLKNTSLQKDNKPKKKGGCC